jgi:hypothetical protein
MSRIQNIFIDEYGDPNLDVDKNGVSGYYILTAIIIDDEITVEETNKALKIIKRHFPKGELKSSKIGKNINHRLEICKELLQLRYHFYSIVYNKSDIIKDSGLKYKESFIKYLHKQLYEVLYACLPSLNIYADEHGRSEFMVSFKKYILDVIKEDFFDSRTFNFVNSKEYPFIQVADFVSGSLARYYDDKKSQIGATSFLALIKEKCLRIDAWPTKKYYNINTNIIPTKYNYDPLIVEHAIRLAEMFISKHERSNDADVELQIRTLKYLLFNFKFIAPNKYVSAKDIVDHLLDSTNKEISLQKLRLNIIAKLRDADIIIASSSNGYKIPLSINDMYDFVERTNNVVLPMLERIKRARNQYLFISKNEVDIIDSSRYSELKDIIVGK